MMIGYNLLGVVALACAIWIIYDVLAVNKKLSVGMKIVWIVFGIVFSIIAAIVYYLVYKK